MPQGIAVDGSDLLVSLQGVSGDNRVVRVASDGTVSTVAGTANGPGFVDGIGEAARLDSPAGLYNDGAGNLYIADSANFVVRKMTIASGSVATYAGALSVGSADGTGNQARFSAPQGLAVDDRTVYVADTGNHTIRAIELATGNVTTLAGVAGQSGHVDGPLGTARFNGPLGLALDTTSQMLYVAETLNRAIRRINLAKGAVTTLSYLGPESLDGPSGLALDGTRLFVADADDDSSSKSICRKHRYRSSPAKWTLLAPKMGSVRKRPSTLRREWGWTAEAIFTWPTIRPRRFEGLLWRRLPCPPSREAPT